jgi:PAS domain S-box-containing protein
VDTSQDAIISKNLDGIIQTWNRGAERIFGYTAEEVVGKPVTVLMPPERINEEPGILARLRAGERIDHYQTVRRHKDGTLLDISLTVSPIWDKTGRVIAASKIARDITAQKRAEEALRDSERRLQELLAAIPAAIYTTDAEGKITYYNEAAVEFAGRRPIIGGDEWCVSWKLYWPDGTPLPHDECPMAIALKENRPIRGKEAIAERPDGSRIPFIPFLHRCMTPAASSSAPSTCWSTSVNVNRRKQTARADAGAQSPRQEQHADVAISALRGEPADAKQRSAGSSWRCVEADCGHGRGSRRTLRRKQRAQLQCGRVRRCGVPGRAAELSSERQNCSRGRRRRARQ